MLQNVLIHLIISAGGVIVGISAFIVFFFIYGNNNVGFWSILSGVLALACFHLHWMKGRKTLERYHTKSTLRYLNFVGFVSLLCGVAAFIWYLFLTFYYNIPIKPISESTIISALSSMITGKWAILLMYNTHKYELTFQEGSVPILTESNN